MKFNWINLLFVVVLLSCEPQEENQKTNAIQGTWELVGAMSKEGVEVIDTFVPERKMIKIITSTHFSFVSHDLNQGQDSLAFFSAGAGTYTLEGSKYTEQLEYCIARNWEGHVFDFDVQIKGDTLIQQGVEKIEGEVDRYIIETYVREK